MMNVMYYILFKFTIKIYC